MKTLTNYTEQATADLMNECGAFFAFSDTQFEEKKKADVKYVNCGHGLICPKENAKVLLAGIRSIAVKGREQDMLENGKDAIIERELRNYETFYTGDIQDTVDALVDYGITADEVNAVYVRLRDTVEC